VPLITQHIIYNRPAEIKLFRHPVRGSLCVCACVHVWLYGVCVKKFVYVRILGTRVLNTRVSMYVYQVRTCSHIHTYKQRPLYEYCTTVTCKCTCMQVCLCMGSRNHMHECQCIYVWSVEIRNTDRRRHTKHHTHTHRLGWVRFLAHIRREKKSIYRERESVCVRERVCV